MKKNKMQINWIKFDFNTEEENLKLGTLIKLKNGSVLMIGDVNKNLGYCDCCRESSIDYYSNDLVQKINHIKDSVD